MNPPLLPSGRNGRPPQDAQLRQFWNFVQRNRLLVFGIPTLVLLATAAFLLWVQPRYESLVTLQVDQEESALPALDALRGLSSSGDEVETEMEVLRSRSIAEAVVDALGLNARLRAPRKVPRVDVFSRVESARDAPEGRYRFTRQDDGRYRIEDRDTGHDVGYADPGSPVHLPGVEAVLAPGARWSRIELRITPFQKAVEKFQDRVTVYRPNREADVIAAGYHDTDPNMVRDVPNALAAAYISRKQAVHSEEARTTVRFLGEQLDSLSMQLEAAEDRLKDFRQKQQVLDPAAEAEAQVGRLVELQAERDMVEAERSALGRLMDDVSRDTAEEGPGPSPLRRLAGFPTLLRNPAVASLLQTLNEVENERAALLERQTMQHPDVEILSQRIHEIEAQLGTTAATYLDGLGKQQQSLDAVLGRFRQQLDRIPAKDVRYAQLMRQTGVLQSLDTLLQTRLKEAEITAAVEDPGVRVVDPSIRPLKPSWPSIPLSLGMALVVGIVLGVGAGFAREHMDTRVRTREDLGQVAPVPVLAMIPRIADALEGTRSRKLPAARSDMAARFQQRLIAARDPRSPISEAYRSLRTNITFSRPGRATQALVFTSPEPGEGKSTSCSNLVATLAQQGARCLLVDADLRRGVLHKVLGVPREPGLSDVLLGAVDRP